LTSYQSNYRRLAFIATGLEVDNRFVEQAEREAADKGWKFEKLVGDLTLLRRLVNGSWSDEDFLVLRPGEQIVAEFDDRIIAAVRGEGAPG